MSRSQPYRQRVPTHVIQLLDVASRITLFKVGQSGPLSFTFKDRLDNKYKVSIGPEVKCSCSPNRNDHCIHSIYVLFKIFRMSSTNPLIWQAAYVDSELNDIVDQKHATHTTNTRRVHPFSDVYTQQHYSSRLLPSENLRKVQPMLAHLEKAQRMKLNADSACPICQEAMSEEMCLSYCRAKCGNNFHLECIKVWAKHKMSEEAAVTCPMCRAHYPHNYLQYLEQEERTFNKKQMAKNTIKFNCASCGVQNIPKNPFKCLLCVAFQLCQCCYHAGKHIKHPFIMQNEDGRWRGAEERREKELKIKNFIDRKKKELNNHDLLAKIRSVEEDPNKLIDYIASAYPYVSKYISENIDPYKKMDFNPADIKCCKCTNKKMIFMRRLTCGHFLDHECLKENIVREKFFCPEDGSTILKGYENLIRREKELQRQKEFTLIQKEYYQSNQEREPQRRVEREPQRRVERHEPQFSDYNFVNEPVEEGISSLLSARRNPNQNQIERRISNNVFRESPSVEARSNRQSNSNNNNRQIRIRSISSKKKTSSRPPVERDSIANRARKKRENFDEMIEALIGRKLK